VRICELLFDRNHVIFLSARFHEFHRGRGAIYVSLLASVALLFPPCSSAAAWMWTLLSNITRTTYPCGYAETREAAMAAFAKSWRRE
jgi:hypothetical protein